MRPGRVMSGDQRLGAVLVGAQKCATSSLATWLERHEEVCHSTVKEPHFWVRDRTEGDVRAHVRAQFGHRRSGDLLVEASTSYSMADEIPGVPERLHRHNPDMRIVYSVRDPVRRVESHLVHRYLNGRISRPSLRTARDDPSYLGRSRFAHQLEQYLAVFPAAQVHVVVLEDLTADPEAVLTDLCRFLDLTPPAPVPPLPPVRGVSRVEGWTGAEVVLARAGIHLPHRLKRRVRKVAGRRAPDPVLTEAERAQVRELLADDVARLERLLGRGLPWSTGTTSPAGS